MAGLHPSDRVEVGLGFFRISNHGFGTFLPVGRADFTVLVGELEGLQQTQGFIHASTDWQIIDCDLTQSSLRVNDEQTTRKIIMNELCMYACVESETGG